MVGDETVVPSRGRAFATFRLTRGNARAQVTGDDDAFAFADEHQTTNRNLGVALEARDFRRELGSGDEQRNAGARRTLDARRVRRGASKCLQIWACLRARRASTPGRIETTRGDVCSDEHVDFARAKVRERRVARRLRQVAV